MLEWITDYITYVEKHPQSFNKNVKNNIRQIKELISRKNIFYKKNDPVRFEKFTRLFKHREGALAGKSLVLNMEQRYISACILGIKEWSNEYNCYVRYFNELDLFVARKWGKDHYIAPLITYFLGLDKEPSAWGQIVAENSSQSERTFEIVQKEIQDEPLNEKFRKTGSKEHRKIICDINDGKLEYLSGRIKGKDGSNPSFAVANEVHEITKFNQYLSLKSGMGGRKQPMMIVISSAGITPASLYEFIYDRNEKFLKKAKLGKNDRIFALMYGIDPEDDIEDESCWIKANPAMYENRPTLKFLRSQWQSMKDDPITKNTFISKHLNRQIGASMDYFDMPAIKNCMREILEEDYYDSYAVGGVDLAETTDLCNATAMVLSKTGKLIILQAYFIASECLDRNSKHDKIDYQIFERTESENEICQQLLIITPGSYVAKEYVTQWFVKLRDEYSVTFQKIGYDRWMSKEWIGSMEEAGFSHEHVTSDKEDMTIERDFGILTEVAQGGYTLSGAIKIIKSLFADNKIEFDIHNKLLNYCFYNLRIRQDTNNNLTPHKAKSTGHIDGAIGVFNAFVAYQRAKELYCNENDSENYLPEYYKI